MSDDTNDNNNNVNRSLSKSLSRNKRANTRLNLLKSTFGKIRRQVIMIVMIITKINKMRNCNCVRVHE